MAALIAHHRQLKIWAENCPENFENRAALVAAEIARIEGRELDAIGLYETAIRSSHANGFINNEALAYERASEFHRARGFGQFADAYLLNARTCYASWGADGKVKQLERLYPDLKPEQSSAGPSSTITAPVDGLDLATVIRVSQAVSSEIVLEKLLSTVLRNATEQAGAERGLLITPRGGELRVEAESRAYGNDVSVQIAESSLPATAIPDSIVRHVMQTHESVILDDASFGNPFSDDVYILRSRARSVLCLPLLKQAQLTGILYLENKLAPHVFTAERITVLKVLASQAALSLENTRLYRSLEDREARIRRLVDANILGICIWNLDGSIIDANEAFLRMLQYDREDLASGLAHWSDLTPIEWRHLDEPALNELRTGGVFQPVEKEYFRKDGSRVPVLIGGALFQEGGNEGVAFVLDLTERKRVEQTLRERKSNLTNMNRVSMLGELAASLAHEILQPIAAARNNARAALNFLDMQPPDLGEVEEAIGCVVADADRARGIVDRIRDQIKNSPPRKDRFDLNAAVNEVVGLARSTITKNGVLVQTRLAERLASIQGDRIQVQQVLLNLVLNAVEAMDSVDARARELSITTEQEPDVVLVAVRDSGPGIDPAHLERVFEAFYTTKASGVGMGLSICRSIIAAHGGRLWADANEPHGATFRFSLPRG